LHYVYYLTLSRNASCALNWVCTSLLNLVFQQF